jgi:tRNA dimethylallyltransferase
MAAMVKGALLIAGPTASGKSAVALAVAERLGGVVINADSMQVYRELRILTARPTAAEEARAPHRLYGVVSAAEQFSVGKWLPRARAEVAGALAAGRLPIVVGGTGLYFAALTAGLAPVPEIPPAVRAEARKRLAALGPTAFRAELIRRDPASADLRDPQRLLRAWAVVEATGTPLAAWREREPEPGLSLPWVGVVLARPRDELYRRIDGRFEDMLRSGALEEVRALSGVAPDFKATGVPELRAHLRGELDLAGASAAARQATRRYAKRQLTWLRHKMSSWCWLDAQDSERLIRSLISKMIESGLTAQS